MASKKFFISIFLLIIINIPHLSQSTTFQGKILDYDTYLPLEGVNIYDGSRNLNAVTDRLGNFILKGISSDSVDLTFSFIGYSSQKIRINIKDSGNFKNIFMVPAPVTLGEVTITSTKTGKSLKEIPLPIEIANKDLIQKSSAITAADLLSTIPGIALQRDGIWATSINIRGLGSSSLVMLIDGSRIETATDLAAALSLIDLNNIERIEIIKGSASSLYGTGALGGVLNFISKSPTYSENLSLNGSSSTYYNSVNKGYSQNINFNLKRDFWYVGLNGTIRKALNSKTPSGFLDNSQYSDNNISALLEILPLTNQTLKFNYENYKADDVGIPGGYPLFPNNANVKYSNVQRNLFSAEYEIKNISKLLNKISLKYYNQNIYRNVENIPFTVQHLSPLQNVYVEKITPNARHYTNGIQLQTNLIPDSSQIFTIGIDAWQRKLDSRRERNLKIEMLDSSGSVRATSYQTIGERPLPEASFTSVGIFVQDDFILNEKIKLMLGGRIDRINVSNSEVSNPVYVIIDGRKNNSPSNETLYWHLYNANQISWSGNIGIIYSLTNKFDITFNVARSFRSPSLEERYQYIDLGNLVRLGNPNLNPEKGYFFDLGFRIWDQILSMRWNLFLNILNDLVSEIPGNYENRPALIKTNIGKANLYGSDFSFEFIPLEWSSLYFNASYIIGRDILNNSYLSQISPFNGRLGLKLNYYNFDFDLSSTFFAAQNNIAAGEIATPGYIYFDFLVQSPLINFNFMNSKISAGIQNITNLSYRNHLSTNRGLIKEEPGRNFFLKLDIGW